MALKTVEVNVKDMSPQLQKEALKRGYSMDGTAPVEYEDTSSFPYIINEAPCLKTPEGTNHEPPP